MGWETPPYPLLLRPPLPKMKKEKKKRKNFDYSYYHYDYCCLSVGSVANNDNASEVFILIDGMGWDEMKCLRQVPS